MLRLKTIIEKFGHEENDYICFSVGKVEIKNTEERSRRKFVLATSVRKDDDDDISNVQRRR